MNLTKPQARLLADIRKGVRVNASYEGGPADDWENWMFSIWHEDGLLEARDERARALLRAGVVETFATDLGYTFLRALDAQRRR